MAYTYIPIIIQSLYGIRMTICMFMVCAALLTIYLLLGVVTQHVETRVYEKCKKTDLNEKVACCLLH